MPAPAQIQTDEDCTAIITRSFDAPRHLVWEAFTDGTLLAHWLLGPPGWVMEVCEINLTPDGGYRWRWRHQETGQEFGFKGTYLAVDPQESLVDRQIFDQGDLAQSSRALTHNTTQFEDEGRGCRVTTTVRYADNATRDSVVAQGLAEGMEASYHCLDQVLLRAAA